VTSTLPATLGQALLRSLPLPQLEARSLLLTFQAITMLLLTLLYCINLLMK